MGWGRASAGDSESESTVTGDARRPVAAWPVPWCSKPRALVRRERTRTHGQRDSELNFSGRPGRSCSSGPGSSTSGPQSQCLVAREST
jgi:hypothetical protein